MTKDINTTNNSEYFAPPQELSTIINALDDKRAKDIVALDLSGVSETLSYFVVATGESILQLKAMQDSVYYALKDNDVLPRGIEGPSERWVLMDYGDTVVHVMSQEARDFYDLEGLWADARALDIESMLAETSTEDERTANTATTTS